MVRIFLMVILVGFSFFAQAQLVQPERNDTTYLMPKLSFDSVKASSLLLGGTAVIKGVAYTKPPAMQRHMLGNNKIIAKHVKITLFPFTPYFEEYLKLKKKQRPAKLIFTFLSPEAYSCRLECITNSDGEFTFSNLKAGKYYVSAVVNWSQTKYYDKYVGSGSSNYGSTDYYSKQAYTDSHGDYISEEVEVKNDGEIVDIKLH